VVGVGCRGILWERGWCIATAHPAHEGYCGKEAGVSRHNQHKKPGWESSVVREKEKGWQEAYYGTGTYFFTGLLFEPA
jgi:hypothetical protein